MKTLHQTTITLTALSATFLLAGCGGGASSATTVKIKRSADASSTVASTDGDAKKSGGTAAAGGYGTLVGKIVYKGANPNLSPIIAKGAAKRDQQVCAATMNIPNDGFVVGDAGGLANVFIYLDRKPKGAKAPSEVATIEFDQQNCLFTTHALVAQVGQTIIVKSDDAVAHNTHTNPSRNSSENFTVKPNDRVGIPLIYKDAERAPFSVTCDIHNWMRSYHLPLDHPYGAVTKPDGSFEIPDLPAGKHEFSIWHEAAAGKGFLDRGYKVTIEPDKSTPVEITFEGNDFDLSKVTKN